MDSATASARYDRQIRVWGKEAQGRLMTAKVLIAGLSGLNIEVAKNLALAGVNVTLQDDEVVSPKDIGVNFFLTAEHIGRYRYILLKWLTMVTKLISLITFTLYEV